MPLSRGYLFLCVRRTKVFVGAGGAMVKLLENKILKHMAYDIGSGDIGMFVLVIFYCPYLEYGRPSKLVDWF